MGKPQPNIFTIDSTVMDMSKTEVIEGKQYLPDPQLAKVADKVIDDQSLSFGEALIDYLLVYPNISKKTAAKCIKSGKLQQHYSGYHFVILISGEMWDMLDDETRYILMFHQLMHIDARYTEKKREWVYSVRPHDVQDFYRITDKYGTTWYKTIQATVSSLYDLSPRDESAVKV